MVVGPEHRSPVTPTEIDAGQRPVLRRYSSWQKFHYGPRRSARPLLKNLAEYRNAVLVAGCQRSGTTMLTRIIAGSVGFRALALTADDELDAALALCGEIDLPPTDRYCFQTTYLNECFSEYSRLGQDQRLIWVLRNPYSVVRSMTHNWRRFALHELYVSCGQTLAVTRRLRRHGFPWPMGPSQFEKACLSYAAKTTQVESIVKIVPRGRLLIVDYDAIVRAPQESLTSIFAFIGEPYVREYSDAVRIDSVNKSDELSDPARKFIELYAEPTYRRCLKLVSATAD